MTVKKQAKRSKPTGNQRQTAEAKPLIVQFFHPGRECRVRMSGEETNTEVPWTMIPQEGGCGQRCGFGNTRRLICHPGSYVNGTGGRQSGQLAFWGEWEADTVAGKMPNPPDDRWYAHWIHSLRAPLGAKRRKLLDTDPCVFGRTFKYCFCQQRKNNSLRHLAPGSLVLFGSTVAGCFHLDTLFVVGGEGISYKGGRENGFHVSEEYRELTLTRVSQGEHTFYRGKTFKEGEPYSFIPARRFKEGDPECGRRFKLDVNAVNRCLPRGSSGLIPDLRRFHHDIPVDRKTLTRVWREILRQVRKEGFLPAVHFGWPEKTKERRAR